MKRILRFGVITLIVSCPYLSFGQCGSTLTMISYDTTVTGAGNDNYIFNVPKFNPSLGDLKEVQLTSQVTTVYSFDVENRDTRFVANVRVRVTREDNITNPALGTPYTNTISRTTAPFNLGPKDANAGRGADFHADGPMDIIDEAQILKRGFNVTPFMGPGFIPLTYSTMTYGTVIGSSQNNFSQRTTDVMRFTVSYLYCPSSSVLNEHIKTFKAVLKGQAAQISWSAINDHNRRYQVQVSDENGKFKTIHETRSAANANANANYLFNYPVDAQGAKNLSFRLKVINNDGSYYYTAIQSIDLSNRSAAAMQVSPNPAHDEVQVMFGNSTRGSWKVTVLNMTGQPLKEYYFKNAVSGRLSLKGTLPKGIYFVQAVNLTTNQKQVARLVVQ